MTVNVTTCSYYPHVNGLSIVAQQNVKVLIELGYNVNVFSVVGTKSLFGERVFNFDVKGNGRFLNSVRGDVDNYINKLRELSKNSELNIHHAWHSWNTNLSLNCQDMKCKQIVYSHGTGFSTLEPFIKRFVRRILYYKEKKRLDRNLKIADAIIFITSNKDHPRCYDSRNIDSSKPFAIIPNPCPERITDYENNQNYDILKAVSLFCSGDQKIALNISNFEKIKNQKFLIDLLKNNVAGFKLILVGSTKTTYYNYLVRYARKNNVLERVLFLTQIDAAVIDFLLKKANFFAFSSKNDFAPLALIEANKYGLPFISFETADNERKGGFFCKNKKEYSAYLQKLLTLPKRELQEIGFEGNQYYRSTNIFYKYKDNIEKFMNIILEK